MRQRELLEFRTPQHPSSGTNKWGGASPLLARNIPKESLEQRYTRLNTVRTRDEIFPAAQDDEHFNSLQRIYASKYGVPPPSTPTSSSIKRFLLRLMHSTRKENATTLGLNSQEKRWFPRWDPKNRWPQGWC